MYSDSRVRVHDHYTDVTIGFLRRPFEYRKESSGKQERSNVTGIMGVVNVSEEHNHGHEVAIGRT